MIKNSNDKPKENELKYIIKENEEIIIDEIIAVFISNNFKVISTTEKQNNDEYFDTKDLSLYKSGGSLRIRETTQNNKTKIKGTYKTPFDKEEIYMSRTEVEEPLIDSNFNSFESKMKEKEVQIDFGEIIKTPILNAKTNRTDILFEKDDVQVCLSLDNTIYTNHFFNETTAIDKMIEIETVGELTNKTILNEIHEFLIHEIKNLIITKRNKYQRGIEKTLSIYNQNKLNTRILKFDYFNKIEGKSNRTI